MADAVIDLQATNLFGLHASFNTQNSSIDQGSENPSTNDESGNVSCQRIIGLINNLSQSATYCGSDFVADFGTFLTQFGNVQNGALVTQITINMTAGDYATVEITGHQHVVNPHVAGLAVGYADVSDFLPHDPVGEAFDGWDGFGVPDFGVTVGADASPSSATVTFTMNHVDTNDENGDHLVGKNITPRCELSMDFEGTPTSNTSAAIKTDLESNSEGMLLPLVDSVTQSDSNSEFDTFAFTAHANTDLETV